MCNNTSRNQLQQALFSNFTKTELKFGEYIFDKCFRIENFYKSQKTISRAIGCSVRTIIRIYKKFRKLGIFTTAGKFHDMLTVTINPLIYEYAYEFKNAFRSLAIIALEKFFFISNRNVTPYKEDIVKYPLYMKVNNGGVCDLVQNVYVGTRDFLKKITKTRGREMREAGKITISPTLKDISSTLRLSRLGQVKLLSFPDEILAQNWGQLKKLSGIRDPFGFLVISCTKLCEKKNLPVDWEIYYLLMKRYDLKDDKRYIMPVEKRNPLFVNYHTKTHNDQDALHNLRARYDLSKPNRFTQYLPADVSIQVLS